MNRPLFLTDVGPADIARGDGDEFLNFTQFLRVTKDSVGGFAGEPMVMRPWQSDMIRRLLARKANGRLKHRQALIGVPRKNGKSALGAGIALYGLAFGPRGGEVFSCAADKEQAPSSSALPRR